MACTQGHTWGAFKIGADAAHSRPTCLAEAHAVRLAAGLSRATAKGRQEIQTHTHTHPALLSQGTKSPHSPHSQEARALDVPATRAACKRRQGGMDSGQAQRDAKLELTRACKQARASWQGAQRLAPAGRDRGKGWQISLPPLPRKSPHTLDSGGLPLPTCLWLSGPLHVASVNIQHTRAATQHTQTTTHTPSKCSCS